MSIRYTGPEARLHAAEVFRLQWLWLVLLGAVTRVALVAGALLMAVLTLGSALHQDWDVAGLQLIYALVYFVLIGFRRYNGFSVDGFFNRPRRTQRH